jgi:hypothetical protein
MIKTAFGNINYSNFQQKKILIMRWLWCSLLLTKPTHFVGFLFWDPMTQTNRATRSVPGWRIGGDIYIGVSGYNRKVWPLTIVSNVFVKWYTRCSKTSFVDFTKESAHCSLYKKNLNVSSLSSSPHLLSDIQMSLTRFPIPSIISL